MYGVLAAEGGLVALATAKGAQSLAPSDLLLLLNFVYAHDSFRTVRSHTYEKLDFALLERASAWP